MKRFIKKLIVTLPYNIYGILLGKRKMKIINRLYQEKEIAQKKVTLESLPSTLTLSLSNNCNMSCKICSVNNLKRRKFKRVSNNITLQEVQAFDSLLPKVGHISFVGHIGESILNPNFDEIVKYLKYVQKNELFISTNGAGVSKQKSDMMISAQFDSINFSIHAATSDTYKKLQGGNFDQILENLKYLLKEREKQNKEKPHVTLVYALNKENINETDKIIDFAKENNLNSVYFYQYRDYGYSDIVLDDDYKYANMMIDQIYNYAKDKDALALLPKKKPYFKEKIKCENESNISCDGNDDCFLPWTGMQMRSSYSHHNTYYLGCCNVFNTFLFNYKEHIEAYGKLQINKIWNHPIFKYLRKTVNNSTERRRNPLCNYCKSRLRDYYKDIDNKRNYELKLQKIDDFFKEFTTEYQDIPDIKGLKILFSEDDELKSMADYL